MIREHADDKSINRNMQRGTKAISFHMMRKGWLNFGTVMNAVECDLLSLRVFPILPQ